jgi:hypothetical protein
VPANGDVCCSTIIGIPLGLMMVDRLPFVFNLRRTGAQNTKRDERLEFSRLDPYPSVFIQGVGEYDDNRSTKRGAVAPSPEFGTGSALWTRRV